ncbi:Glutamine--tRNA ligase [bioreactor metagenome]|uniref:Glutamine--tRNA ligase n=1 Tax=bioreactor metagenome TaxID=1076179 RepID=A0A645G046_9ZZZZ
MDAATALDAEVRLYDSLFLDPEPDAGDKNFLDCLNPNSLEVLTGCKVEAGLESPGTASYQFMRQGYFCADSKDSRPGHLVFNRSVSLKDSFHS